MCWRDNDEQVRMMFAGLMAFMGPWEFEVHVINFLFINCVIYPSQPHLFTPFLLPHRTGGGSHSC